MGEGGRVLAGTKGEARRGSVVVAVSGQVCILSPLVSHDNLSILHSSSHSCCPVSHTGRSPLPRHSGKTGHGTYQLGTHTHSCV